MWLGLRHLPWMVVVMTMTVPAVDWIITQCIHHLSLGGSSCREFSLPFYMTPGHMICFSQRHDVTSQQKFKRHHMLLSLCVEPSMSQQRISFSLNPRMKDTWSGVRGGLWHTCIMKDRLVVASHWDLGVVCNYSITSWKLTNMTTWIFCDLSVTLRKPET